MSNRDFYSVGTQASFPLVKQLGCEADH